MMNKIDALGLLYKKITGKKWEKKPKNISEAIVKIKDGFEAGGSGEETEYASKAIYNDNALNMGRNSYTNIGEKSCAFGNSVEASGNYSHAEGNGTKASGNYSHAEGNSTKASGNYSHAEGNNTTASGLYSHAEGYATFAYGYQLVCGSVNRYTTPNEGRVDDPYNNELSYFIIGNGTEGSGRSGSNAFRVERNGKVFAQGAYASTGADYAEYFEWLDGNKDSEDRRGFFVAMDGDKIKKASANDYILGIVSGQPAVLGNNDECYMGRYEFDEFGCYVQEEITVKQEKFNEKNGEMEEVETTAKCFKEKESYDPTIKYIPRSKRKEWSAIGMLGVLSVRDDGTCEVNGFCRCGENGIATKADEGYRVIKRVNKNIVKVILK